MKISSKLSLFLLVTTSSLFSQEWKQTSNQLGIWAEDKNHGTNIKIGIGTTSPSSRLEVFGRVKLHSTVYLDSTINIGSNLVLNGLNGTVKNTAWSGTGNRLIFTDGSGNLIPLPQGTSNQYLSGNGTWVNVPNVSNLWSTNGTSTYYNNGYVGIGTSSPLFPLDVIGDARISNNLYVGGGIVISDKISAITEIKGWDFKVDNDINIEGSSRLKGATRLDQGFTFDGAIGISYSASNNLKTFHYGSSTGARPAATNCAAAPYSGVLNQFGGWLQIYDPANPTTSGLLNFQTWAGGSSIDASVSGNTPTNVGASDRLLINYFCGNSTFINTGPNGGEVYLGKTHVGNPLTTSSTHFNDALLTVNGKIVAKSCYITIDNWADYVFAKDYKLPNLYDIEKYYLVNHHLPEVPSEKEVIENGIDIAEMNKVLLKKIEELTILMVSQQKQIDALQSNKK